jgi:hypothetical protein
LALISTELSVSWFSGKTAGFDLRAVSIMTRTALEGFGKSLLASDEVVIEATANSMGVSRVLAPFVARVIIANPLQVKAIAVLGPVKAKPSVAANAASLARPCARRLRSAAGTEECPRRGRTKE